MTTSDQTTPGTTTPGTTPHKLDLVLEDLHEAENELHVEIQRLGERHGADQEVAHVSRDLARWSAEHVRRIAEVGVRFGLHLSPQAVTTNALAAGVRRKSSELTGRRHTPALLLLDDLRQLYGDTAQVQLDWEMLGQAAKAVQDQELVELAESCRSETLRQLTWAEAKLKESAPQALTTP